MDKRKEFPNEFFTQLDKLYDNPKTTSKNRPMYYGNFINKYVYTPLEGGKILPKLKEVTPRQGKGYRKNKHHQHLKREIGLPQFRIQMGKILGIMEISPNMRKFKNNFERTTGNLTLFED